MLKATKPLPKEEQRRLFDAFKAGDIAARDTLILSLHSFVVMIAKRYIPSQAPLEDLVMSGHIGLLKALDTYDPEKGLITTYSARPITYAVRRCAQDTLHGRMVGPRVHSKQEVKAMKLWKAGEHDPDRLAELSGLRIDSARSFLAILATRETYIDAPRDGHSEATFHDVLGDDEAAAQDEAYLDQERDEKSRDLIRRALATLRPRERMIVTRRWLIQDREDAPTLQDIGLELELTRERVRQIESKALKKIQKFIVWERKMAKAEGLSRITKASKTESLVTMIDKRTSNDRSAITLAIPRPPMALDEWILASFRAIQEGKPPPPVPSHLNLPLTRAWLRTQLPAT